MGSDSFLVRACESAGLSQAAMADAAGTSRPTLSAYERGRKSPTLNTATRIIGETGFELTITPKIEFREVATDRGHPIHVPTALPQLPIEKAFAAVELPLHLDWSDSRRRYDLRDRRQRARVYEIVLREAAPQASSPTYTGHCWSISGTSLYFRLPSAPLGGA